MPSPEKFTLVRAAAPELVVLMGLSLITLWHILFGTSSAVPARRTN